MATAAIVCMMFDAAAARQLNRGQGRKEFSGESDSHKSTLFGSVMRDFFFSYLQLKCQIDYLICAQSQCNSPAYWLS